MRAFDVRNGGRAADGRFLPGFFSLRVGPLTLAVLARPVGWPRGWAVVRAGGCLVLRWGRVVLCLTGGK